MEHPLKCWKPTFHDGVQLIQPDLYATIGLIQQQGQLNLRMGNGKWEIGNKDW
jgi:hypothetical protein